MAGIDNDLQLVKIARLYYELGYKQEQIAQMEKISKATVSRLLDKAHKEGIVEVKVVYPQLEVHELAEEIEERFNLKKACVVPVMIDHPDVIRDDLGRAVSNFLSEIIRDEDIIGVSWGTTLPFVVKNLSKINANNVIVTQLNGGVTKQYLSTQSAAIIEGFVTSLNAVPYMLPVPTIVDSVELAAAISADSNVCKTLELSQKARIAVYGIGKAGFDSILVQAGYFQKEEYEKLLQAGAVGDICSRYFRIDGSIVDQELNQRTVGITLEELRNKEYSIAVANGQEKAEAVVGALMGKYVNTLFIDEVTAKRCLELIKSEE